MFENEDGSERPVTGEELGGVLAGKGIPIVLLNACQSGMTRPDALYPSVGNQLLKAGARGVVAMTYSVYVQTAVQFMARLYQALMNGEALSRAVALAREDLRTQAQRFSPIGDIQLQDWMVPALFEAAPVQVVQQPTSDLHLDPNLLQDEQAKAGAEVNCPEPPTHGFVGRDSEVLTLEQAFQTETIVLLNGMAGVGKTQTAIGFARWLAETGALAGPILFFNFEQHLPLAQVCDRVGQEFQQVVKDQLRAEWHLLNTEQRRSVALNILRQVPCLLIWDNFEPVAGFPTGSQSVWTQDEQQVLRDFLSDLRGGQTRVLLTSRRDEAWLGNIYRRVNLRGLRLLEAQELAIRVLQRTGLKPQEIKKLSAYNALLKYLRGNPLAIQVILPELRTQQPDTLLQDLKTGEARLSADDPAQGREHSLTASLTYRLDALDPTLRQRLGLLGLFQGFVSVGVLAAMCQADDAPELIRGVAADEWVRMLDSAAEIGLLRRVGEGFYTIQPALPWFFHDLLDQAFPDKRVWLEQTFSTVQGAYGSQLNNLFTTNPQTAMALLQAEEANLIRAVSLARQHEQWGAVEVALCGLNRLLTIQGRWVEWERLITDIETEATDSEGEPLTGKEDLWIALLDHRSGILFYRRDFEREQQVHIRRV